MNFRFYDNDGSATLKISAFKVSFGDLITAVTL